MKKYYIDSSKKETLWIQRNEGRLTVVITCCVGIALYNKLSKTIWKGKMREKTYTTATWCNKIVMILELETGSSGMHSVENSVWKCLSTYH